MRSRARAPMQAPWNSPQRYARRFLFVVLCVLAAPGTAGAQATLTVDLATVDARRIPLGPPAFSAAEDSEDDPDAMFQSIATAFRLHDGRLIVADGSTRRLAIYDQSGTVLGSWGRTGAGPGERRS